MTRSSSDARGVLLVLVAAAGFAGLALWAKQAYADGWSPQALLAARFVLVAAAFWAIVALRGGALPARRVAAGAFALGMTAYALENHLYFAAVERIDVGLLALIVSAYPAVVVGGAALLGRERPDARRLAALAIALGGAVLVLAGAGGAGGFDALGAALGVGCAVTYGAYLLAGDKLVGSLDPFALGALVASGAAMSLTATAAAGDDLTVPASSAALTDLAGLVLVSSVLPLAALWLGIQRLGAPTASIVATIEPAITVTLAAVLFGEHLADLQLAGGALVVSAVVLLNARLPRRATSVEIPALPAARALAHEHS